MIHPYVAPLAISLFFFILIANWLELIPSKLNEDTPHLLAAPTADTNLTYALAAMTIVSVWIYGIGREGVKGYFKHFLEPFGPAALGTSSKSWSSRSRWPSVSSATSSPAASCWR